MTTRRATAPWSGDLVSGSGTVSAYTTSLFSDLPVSWASRTEEPDGRTSPEELLAAAHAACSCDGLFEHARQGKDIPRRSPRGGRGRVQKVGDGWSDTH